MAKLWIVSTCIPGDTTPCLPLPFYTEEEAESYVNQQLKEAWPHHGLCYDDGDPLPYPDDWREAQNAIVESDTDNSWGKWEISVHDLPAMATRDPDADILAALKALAGALEAIRDEQGSQGLDFGKTRADRENRRSLIASWIKQNADEVDDALNAAFAIIQRTSAPSTAPAASGLADHRPDIGGLSSREPSLRSLLKSYYGEVFNEEVADGCVNAYLEALPKPASLEMAVMQALDQERERCAKLIEAKSRPDAIKLATGEMSPQEMRAVQAAAAIYIGAIRGSS